MPLPKTFVNTSDDGTNMSPFTPKSASCKLPRVSNKITSRKRTLIGNANYLAKATNKLQKALLMLKDTNLNLGKE